MCIFFIVKNANPSQVTPHPKSKCYLTWALQWISAFPISGLLTQQKGAASNLYELKFLHSHEAKLAPLYLTLQNCKNL